MRGDAEPQNLQDQPLVTPQNQRPKVILKNSLVGQIRQIAMGVDGWTAISRSDLVLDCKTISAERVECEAYPSEPYWYSVEVK